MAELYENCSEVARLLAQIRAEYHAAQYGLSGLSSGSARHDFIVARTETISKCHGELTDLVGPDQAISILANTIWSPADQGREERHEVASVHDYRETLMCVQPDIQM
ncbi:MAG: hypothetical protein NVS2B12_20140 [Ktedonobacteraceae bacterium]